MLTTKALEQELTDHIMKTVPAADLSNIYFCACNEKSPEGVYVFSQNNQYHYVLIEKGKAARHYTCTETADVLWYVLETALFELAVEYAKKNSGQTEDFRKLLFQKEIELFALFGQSFRERKIAQINAILQKYPY